MKIVTIMLLTSILIILCFSKCSDTYYSLNSIKNTEKKQNNRTMKKNQYGVSASHPLAIEEGMKVLKQGGNAVDAAIAISYTLGVVEPYASGLGGGGGMLIVTKDGEKNFIDYRETAPNLSKNRMGDSGIPGFVAGMEFASEKYGSMSMKKLIEPSIHYAEKGFKVDQLLSSRLVTARYRIYSNKLSIFYPNGQAINSGKTLVQNTLAKTLKKIQKNGASAFYQGDIAREMSRATNFPLESIKNYTVEEHTPVEGEYEGYRVYTAPPPFSGVTLFQMLKKADSNKLYNKKKNLVEYITLMGEIQKLSYQDRIKNIGDPNFSNIEIDKLISSKYLSSMITNKNDLLFEEEHESTTHFVVMDKSGTTVSVTNTLSNFFGTGNYNQGFFLNNQLSNFSNAPNQIEPGKRARTFMSPTILEKKGKEIIGIGSPGGNRIPQILTTVIDSYIHSDSDLQTIVDESRFVFEKNNIYTEVPFATNVKEALTRKGYKVIQKYSPMFYGGVQALIRNEKENIITGAGDARREGTWKAHN